jgi:hypothetical protein
MSFYQPVKTRQNTVALLVALPRESVSPSRYSKEEELIQLNQGPFGITRSADGSGPSAFANPSFD